MVARGQAAVDDSLNSRPIYCTLLSTLDCHGSDHEAVYTLVLLYAIGRNDGIPSELLEAAQFPHTTTALDDSKTSADYLNVDQNVIARLVQILALSSNKSKSHFTPCLIQFADSFIRIITVELCCLLLRQMILTANVGEDDPLKAASLNESDASAASAAGSASAPSIATAMISLRSLTQSIRDAQQIIIDHLSHFYR